MHKKPQSRRLISSCYYKFRAHRSLSVTQSNPLLVPNTFQEGSLCPSSTKKSHTLYHHKSGNEGMIRRLSESVELRRSKNMGSQKKKSGGGMEDAIVVSQVCHFRNYRLNHSAKQLRRHTTITEGEGEKINKKQDIQDKNRLNIKNLLQNYETTLTSKTLITKQTVSNFPNQNKRIVAKGSFWRSFPNRHKLSQDYLKNESNLSFRGWDFDPRENQQQGNLTLSKHQVRL